MPSTRVAIAGLGAIGRALARALDDDVPGLALGAVAARDHAKAQAWLDEHEIDCPVVPLDEMPDHADLAV
ncbi:MAG: aspartate dehydrogenase, partial [Bradyrhizobiaceae bacterium]|nr:aspartate dehydrogenase [Bradyrhizobiaceae bacterium]